MPEHNPATAVAQQARAFIERFIPRDDWGLAGPELADLVCQAMQAGTDTAIQEFRKLLETL